jgi:hypothetical protein
LDLSKEKNIFLPKKGPQFRGEEGSVTQDKNFVTSYSNLYSISWFPYKPVE